MRIVRQLDAGPIAGVERVTIGARETALEIEHKLSLACVPLLARALPLLASGELAFIEQDHTAATFCRRLVKEDGRLDFSAPAAVLAARINGLFPWPACSFEIAGQPIKIGLADVVAAPDETTQVSLAEPGTVLGADAEGLCVSTGSGVLRCLRLQKPGGKMLPAPEFLRGAPIAAGTLLSSYPLAPLVAATPFPYKAARTNG
jgi:methionyl-tRNA formyltransferase